MCLGRSLVFVIGLHLVAPALAGAWCLGGALPAASPGGGVTTNYSPARDEDDDGLNDVQEAFFGTDPNNPDTDGNGILDGDEDFDHDGIPNKDEPIIFSLEAFDDPFAEPPRDFALVIEGTNLFGLRRQLRVQFPDMRRSFRVRHLGKLNRDVRLYLRLPREDAKLLAGKLFNVRRRQYTRIPGRKNTNLVFFMRMHCPATAPMLMKSAFIHVKTRLKGVRYDLDYVAIGGCNLLDRKGGRAITRLRLADHDRVIKAPYGGIATLPSRIIVPAVHCDQPGTPRPFAEVLCPGDRIRIVTEAGESNAVAIDPEIANLRIPAGDLDEDHDQDGLTSGEEIQRGTDPLVFDTDHDGSSDGREVALGTDPLDPHSNRRSLPARTR